MLRDARWLAVLNIKASAITLVLVNSEAHKGQINLKYKPGKKYEAFFNMVRLTRMIKNGNKWCITHISCDYFPGLAKILKC